MSQPRALEMVEYIEDLDKVFKLADIMRLSFQYEEIIKKYKEIFLKK